MIQSAVPFNVDATGLNVDAGGSNEPQTSASGSASRVETTALSQLPTGAEATLVGDQLAADDRQILRAMGLTDHAPVRVCRQGEPCIIQVRTTRVGLSRAIADLLQTIPCAPPNETAAGVAAAC